MTKLEEPRGTRALYKSNGAIVGPGAGIPGLPACIKGNRVDLHVDVNVPVTLLGSDADFTVTHPSQAFTFTAQKHVKIVKWEGSSPAPQGLGTTKLFVDDGYVIYGTNYLSVPPPEGSTPPVLADVRVYSVTEDLVTGRTAFLVGTGLTFNTGPGDVVYKLSSLVDERVVMGGSGAFAVNTLAFRLTVTGGSGDIDTQGRIRLILHCWEF